MRRQFYEPEQQAEQASAVRGFPVTITGTYVLLDDVVTVIREYAQSLADADDGALVHELATWLQSGEPPAEASTDAVGEGIERITELVADSFRVGPIDRIEIYPDDPMAMKPHWVGRACSSDGDIMDIGRGSFDQEEAIDEARRNWGDLPVHVVTEAGVDTIWEERDPGGLRSSSSGHRRPSPKRMFA